MRQAPRFTLIWLVLIMCAAASITARGAVVADEDNNIDYPDSRVARVTVIRGDVQIRHANSQEWEEGTPNFPLVEGDRLATGQDARVEIQFDRDNYLRLAEDSILKIVTLNDNGVAVSLPEGVLSVRLGNFKNKRDSFEIDAPETTVAVEREGRYRIDVPQGSSSNELKVTVTDGGQARVYSETSGYTVRSGRSARVFLSGEYAGDVDFTSAEISRDYFDDWVATREDAIDHNRRDDYRGYYDSDVYGADDLNSYGEWVNSSRYGWVWRPYRNSVAAYDNWSPYRYGHWRYIPRYGWTWIADEPWGWATSHYGRWVYLDDGWNWCPYNGYRRHSRWQAALVVFLNIGRNICWYPLPYGSYYSYDRHSRTIIYNNTTIINNNTIVTNRKSPNQRIDVDRDRKSPQSRLVYTNAMNQMPLEKFGKVRGGDINPVPTEEVKKIIDVNAKGAESRIVLPTYNGNTDAKISKEREIINNRDSLAKAERELNDKSSKIGAMPREKGATLDDKLREDRVFKGRTPIDSVRNDSSEVKSENTKQPRTGVFDRQSEVKEKRADNGNNKTRDDVLERPAPRQPKSSIRDSVERSNDRPPLKNDGDNNSKPAERQIPRKPERNNNDDNRRQPSFEPPLQKEPSRREEPRNEPPPRRAEPQRSEPPKQRVEPRPEPPKQKEEPKRDSAPPLSKSEKSGKDGK